MGGTFVRNLLDRLGGLSRDGPEMRRLVPRYGPRFSDPIAPKVPHQLRVEPQHSGCSRASSRGRSRVGSESQTALYEMVEERRPPTLREPRRYRSATATLSLPKRA